MFPILTRRSIVTHKYHVLGMGQGQSAAPEGWSFQNELIDPDAPVETPSEQPSQQSAEGEKAVVTQETGSS
jgi:hypothetical protein